MTAPRVTVLMPVYNGESFLRDAIDSVLAQTFADFELLVIDDGSTDGSVGIVRSYADPRIRLLQNPANLKLVATLNRGLKEARGELIARMDADDISLPARLGKQVAFMDGHPEVGACGAWVETFGEREGDVWDYPTDPDTIRCTLLFRSVIAHPTVMLRRERFDPAGLRYDARYPQAEDFQLWQRAGNHFPLANLGEVLVRYRFSHASVSRANQAEQEATLRRIDAEAIRALGLEPDARALDVHRALGAYRYEPTLAFARDADRWLCALRDANRRAGLYPREPFEQVLGREWLSVSNRLAGAGWGMLRLFAASPLTGPVRARAKGRAALRMVRAAVLGKGAA